MADGYARLTGKPQCVIVHVDVGTQGLAAAVHNASCGRAPVLIFAGLSPYTIEGEMRGSRTEYIHWIQDVPDQKQIVSQYCRYSGEIKTGKNVKVCLDHGCNAGLVLTGCIANGQPCTIFCHERSERPRVSMWSTRIDGGRPYPVSAQTGILEPG